MKQTIIALSLAFLLVFNFATPAFADVRSELEIRRAVIEAQIKTNEARLKNVRQDLTSLGQKSKSEIRFDVAKQRAEIVAKVFDANISRLQKLIQRIESRRSIYVSLGASTTDASSFVTAARANISDATLHLNIIRSLDVSTSTQATSTALTNWNSVKSETKIVRDLLVKAKQNLQKAVNVLAKLEKQYPDANINGTSTASTTNH